MRIRSIFRISSLAAGLALLAAGWPGAAAGDNVPAGNVLYTVGTTFTGGGRSHAYLLWTPTDENLLRLRSYSIWSKPGAADAAGEYQPESWIEVQTDPVVLEGILRRSERLGQDLDKLDGVIDGLFEIFTPGGGLSRGDKLSAILQGAQQDTELYHDLLLLARFYPAVSVCLGAAWTGPVDGRRTYEVRMAAPGDGPHAPDAARRVVGRVTLDPAAYQALPAPGAPVPMPYGKKLPDGSMTPNLKDPRANLNLRMRWATPDPLRERSLLQFGYHVYRVEPAFYTAEGMAGGLEAGDLANYAQAFPDKVKRVSNSPVLIERMLTAAEAADWGRDWNTDPRPRDVLYFLIDDNDRFDPGGTPFEDGDEFRYMVTAVDVLGRDGIPSPGTLMQICRTIGPNPPRNLTVRDQVTHPTSTSTRQVFGLSWQAPTPVDEAPIDRFVVYRWADGNDPITPDGAPPPGDPPPDPPDPWTPPVMVGSVPFQAGVEWYDFEDATLGVPPGQDHMEKPWWFTVRSVSAGACFEIPSPHGPPASGVLRDRSAPSGPVNAVVIINTSRPRMEVVSVLSNTNLPSADPGYLNLRIRVTRASAGVDSADFFYRVDDASQAGAGEDSPLGPAPVGATYLGSIRFHDEGQMQIVTDYRIGMPPGGTHDLTFHLRTRDVHGNLSGFNNLTMGTVSSDPDDVRKEIRAIASHSYAQDGASTGVSNAKHVSRRFDQEQPVAPIVRFQKVPDDMDTWRIYRRIDLGPAVLVKEGSGPPLEDVPAEALAANAGEVSYFVQFLDASGNAGPMIELGHFGICPVEPPPRPMLLPVEALPDQQATLRWACAPHGVARFHVGVAAVGQLPPDTISDELSEAFELRASVPVEIGGETVELDFRMYDSGPLLANNSPEHSVTLDLEEGLTYSFFVEAVSANGQKGEISNLADFGWLMPVDGGPDADWPARPAPQINTAFQVPRATQDGITVGNLSEFTSATTVGNTVRLWPKINLRSYLLREKSGQRQDGRPDRRLLPCVVYRYQLPDQSFPQVSGDVVQVTPMLRDIAARDENIGGTDYTVVYDPYFIFDAVGKEIRLRVPQPMVYGATYRYLLLLFNDDGELDSIVPTTTFTYIIN